MCRKKNKHFTRFLDQLLRLVRFDSTFSLRGVLFGCYFRISGKNVQYGTPINPKMTSHIPGGSSSGSAVAVAAELVDFALGMCVSI